MGVSKNRETSPNHPLKNRFSIIFNHPFWGYPYFWKPPNISLEANGKPTNSFLVGGFNPFEKY